MDADRRLAHRRRLRGAGGWLFVHLAAAVNFTGEPRWEGLLPVGVGGPRVTRLHALNVQHLYVACLDEGKIKNAELCLPGVCFIWPEIYFSPVKSLSLIKLEGQTQRWKIGLIPVALVSLRSRRDATCPEKPQLWSSRQTGKRFLV